MLLTKLNSIIILAFPLCFIIFGFVAMFYGDAAKHGDVEEMVRLLDQGAGINAVDQVRCVLCCFDTFCARN